MEHLSQHRQPTGNYILKWLSFAPDLEGGPCIPFPHPCWYVYWLTLRHWFATFTPASGSYKLLWCSLKPEVVNVHLPQRTWWSLILCTLTSCEFFHCHPLQKDIFPMENWELYKPVGIMIDRQFPRQFDSMST